MKYIEHYANLLKFNGAVAMSDKFEKLHVTIF